MRRSLLYGLAAGAAGTAALNAVTYLDMVLRDRPASTVPAQTAEKLTDLAGISLASEDPDDDSGQARAEGLGALLGYLSGFGVGIAYGLLRPRVLARVPLPLAGAGAGAAATIVTVLPYSALGVSDPTSWPAQSWAADVVPHLCYGLATAATFDALQRPRGR